MGNAALRIVKLHTGFDVENRSRSNQNATRPRWRARKVTKARARENLSSPVSGRRVTTLNFDLSMSQLTDGYAHLSPSLDSYWFGWAACVAGGAWTWNTWWVCCDIKRIQNRCLRIIYPQHSYSEALSLWGLERLDCCREKRVSELFDSIKKPGHILNSLQTPRHITPNIGPTMYIFLLCSMLYKLSCAAIFLNYCLLKYK